MLAFSFTITSADESGGIEGQVAGFGQDSMLNEALRYIKHVSSNAEQDEKVNSEYKIVTLILYLLTGLFSISTP